MKIYFFLFMIISIVALSQSFAETIEDGMPFNPADNTTIGNTIRIMYYSRYQDETELDMGLLAYKQQGNTLSLARESFDKGRSYHEVTEYTATLGDITIGTYIKEHYGVELRYDTEVFLSKEKYCDCDMENNGKVKVMDFHGGKDCYWLHFRVNGSRVSFVEDASIMVDFNIFLNEDVVINGTRQVRIFFLEKYNGKWVRTHPTERITIRTYDKGWGESVSFEKYYKERPWTKLYDYMYGDADEQEIGSLDSIGIGDRVLAKYNDTNYWYVATILELKTGKMKIEWLDETDVLWMETSRIRPFFWKIGTEIVAYDPGYNQWNDGVIRRIEGDYVWVLFHDADFQLKILMTDCRSEGL